jgi:hypothetical protein
MPKNLTESLALAVPLTLLLLHTILIIPSLQPKLSTLPLDSRLQLNKIGSETASNCPRWPGFSSTDPLSSGAIRPVLLRPAASVPPQSSLPCAFLPRSAAPSATLRHNFGFVCSCNLCFHQVRNGGRDGQLEIPWNTADFDTKQAILTCIPGFRPDPRPARIYARENRG